MIWRSLTHQWSLMYWIVVGCELLSICDLTIFDTPIFSLFEIPTWLWIAFNLWFDDLWHTYHPSTSLLSPVVNCFQFVIWRSLTHRKGLANFHCLRCELLSICDLTIFDTPLMKIVIMKKVLWIAFNLWFDDLWHTFRQVQNCILRVVNCFQFVIWRSLTHLHYIFPLMMLGCELLSICDLTIFDTPFSVYINRGYQLWIAFNLWFDDLWHTCRCNRHPWRRVVNCFQFVIWRSLTHP